MKKIVLTGGPCAGKTTGLNYIVEQLEKWGFTTTTVPEAATLLISGGASPQAWRLANEKRYLEFEFLILSTQLWLEKYFECLAVFKGGEKQVMILDRGAMDVRAYCDAKQFDAILRRSRLSVGDLQNRYDAVMHLVTAADGKEEFYTLDNNKARHESPEEARETDNFIKTAWLGHPHLRIIDNSTFFKGKMKRLLKAIQRALGFPVSLEIERKFLLKKPIAGKNIPVPRQNVYIEQAYLKGPRDRIRMRVHHAEEVLASAVYYRTEKVPTGDPAIREEREEQITGREYSRLLKKRDSKREVIQKIRSCFIWKNQYFELDRFFRPKHARDLELLEIELTEANDRIEIPDWLGPVEEVTGNPKYGNYEIARKK